MPSQITNYKCPACTGPLHFSGASGKLECEYCGSVFDVAEIEALYAKDDEKAEEAFVQAEEAAQAQAEEAESNEWDDSGIEDDWGKDADGMRAYNCPSCGAELICDETTAATSCPYCGNPTIVPGQFAGTKKPDLIIPFKLDKNAAVNALKEHYKGKFFLPKSFTAENHINEIKGVYVPFWLFDGSADVNANFHATRSIIRQTRQERIITTEHFDVVRDGTVDFEKIPVDASSKMPDGHMDSIEPFDYNELKPFSTAYLPGYLADKYDISVDDCSARADERAANTALDNICSSVQGFETVEMLSNNVNLRRGVVKYALMPVWMLSTKWNGQDFLFAMNGQTGKLVGDLPMDKKKYWLTFAAIALPVAAIIALILNLL